MSVEKLSRVLSLLFLVPIIGLPSMWVFFFLNIELFKQIAMEHLGNLIYWDSVESWQLFLLCSFLFSCSLVLVWGMIMLRRSFLAFSRSDVFTESNIHNVKRFSIALVSFSFLNMVSHSVASVVLSLNHPAGQKVLSIQLNSGALSLLLVGLIFWVIAKILLRANALQQENNAFV